MSATAAFLMWVHKARAARAARSGCNCQDSCKYNHYKNDDYIDTFHIEFIIYSAKNTL